MVFAGLNYLAVLVAAVAGFAFGGIWYGVLFGKRWRAIVGVDAFKPRPTQMLIAFVAHLLMAWMLAGVVGHLGEVTITRTLISAAFLWVGFVLTTMIVNHRFQSSPWSLTAIDGGHWLGVLLVMGLVIGWLGV